MNGFRFIQRSGKFGWKHPADSQPGDVDCTDMTDIEFQREVCRAVGIFAFCTVPA